MTLIAQEADMRSHRLQLGSDVSDSIAVRKAFAHYPSGIAALAAEVGGVDQVIVASSFSVGVSLEPPLVQFAIQNSSATWPELRKASVIGVSVLSADQSTLCRQLAGPDRANRLTGVDVDRREDGAVLLEDSSVVMECSVFAEYPAGDHTIVVLEIESLAFDQSTEPLVFHGSRFRSLAEPDSAAR